MLYVSWNDFRSFRVVLSAYVICLTQNPWPEQPQSCVQSKLACPHLHLPEQLFWHPHFRSFLQASLASGSVVHLGIQHCPSRFQPQAPGDGSCGSGFSAWAHTCPAWYVALFTCSMRASWVGGMFSNCLFPLEKRTCLASLTVSTSRVLLYRRTTNRSMVAKASCWIWPGHSERTRKASVASGYTVQTSHPVFFPLPMNAETVSQPVIQWKNGRAAALLTPKLRAISWAAIYL